MDCEFCKKTFSSKSNLVAHQKSTKYCLELQGKTNNDFLCQHCSRTFTLYKTLTEHVNVCKKKQIKQEEEKNNEYEKMVKKLEKYEGIEKRLDDKNKENKQLKEKISDQKEYIAKLEGNIEKLEAKLEKFEDTVTSIVLSKTEKKQYTTNTTTNNTTNNIVINNSLNLNDIEKMNTFLDEKLDKEVLAGGQKSFALLMSSTMLKDKYKCVDPSRQNFEFTNELGEIERDVKAKKLTTAIIKSNIRSRSGEKGEELWKKEDGSTDSLRFQANSKNVIEMINFDIDNSTFRSELTALTT